MWSDEYNLPYYFHTVRKETTWYKPDGFFIPLKAVQVRLIISLSECHSARLLTYAHLSQRFSAGKRFSLSLDSGSTVGAPDAPDVSDETSLPFDTSEIDATQNSGLHDSKCDPFYAAVFKCITGKSALPESPKVQKGTTRSRTVSEVKEAKKSSPLPPGARTFYDEARSDVEDDDGLDHVNISGISLLSSSSQTVSTTPSTPLNTPKAPQETFSTPILSSDEYPEVVHAESPYLGIEEAKETVVITADDLIAAIPPIVEKGKTVAPLKIRKKLSMVGLGEPVNLRSPEEKSERGWSKETGTPKLDAAAIQNSNSSLDTGPKTPGSPDTPGTPRSPSSFFSAVFGKAAMSCEISSSSVATLKEAQEEGISYEHQPPATPVAAFDSPKMDEVKKHGDQLKSPTLDKIKKMFASSQDLFRQSEGGSDMKYRCTVQHSC